MSGLWRAMVMKRCALCRWQENVKDREKEGWGGRDLEADGRGVRKCHKYEERKKNNDTKRKNMETKNKYRERLIESDSKSKTKENARG